MTPKELAPPDRPEPTPQAWTCPICGYSEYKNRDDWKFRAFRHITEHHPVAARHVAVPARVAEWQPLEIALQKELDYFRECRDAPMTKGNKTEIATIRKTLNVVVCKLEKLLPPCALTGNEEAPRSPFDSGICCMSAHANATPPWTCSCECHTRKDTEDQK